MVKIALSKRQEIPARISLVAVLVLSVFSTSGCIRKRMTVRTTPSGAMAYIDKQPIGLTPVSTNFTYYGTRSIEIVRDGYRTERLAAFLRALARIADDLDDVLFQGRDRIRACRRSGRLAGFLGGLLRGHLIHVFSVATVERLRCRVGRI